MSLSIHPFFVFDGPNKPPFKRNKRTGPNIASIPELLAKQLLKQFGFPYHIAPGEAEAECALLQREGIVDAVLSEDVDTLMFGSGMTLRNFSPEVTKTQTPTHVNVYDAKKTKSSSGLDREGMILVALMSGGDYVPEGIPGAGPKVACDAARAGFGHDLCRIAKGDQVGFRVWRERLQYELQTNESKFFKRRHGTLNIPEDFPNIEALGYYTRPAISSKTQLDKLRQEIKWDQEINYAELRAFTAEAFDWRKLGGAKKFIRNLSPVVLVKALRLRGQNQGVKEHTAEDIEEESSLVKAFHGKRNHATTDCMTEIRVSFKPIDIVPIDLGLEEPDDEEPDIDSEDDGIQILQDDNEPAEAPGSPTKRRAPPNYDPSQVERLWVAESIIKVGVPLKVEEWENSSRDAKKYLELKHAAKAAKKKNSPKKTKMQNGGMAKGSLDRFARVMKPGQSSFTSSLKPDPPEEISMTGQRKEQSLPPTASQPVFRRPPEPDSFSSIGSAKTSVVITLLSSSPPIEITLKDTLPPFHPGPDSMGEALPSTVTKRRRSPLRRAKTDSAALDTMRNLDRPSTPSRARKNWALDSSPMASPSDVWPLKRSKLEHIDVMDLTARAPSKATPRRSYSTHLSPAKQSELTQYFSPSKTRQTDMLQDCVRTAARRKLNLTKSTSDAKTTEALKQSNTVTAKPPARNPSNREPQETPPNSEKMPPRPSFKVPPPFKRNNTGAGEKIDDDSQNSSVGSSLRRSPRIQKAAAEKTGLPDKGKKKEIIRIRESLPGTFAIEEVDLTETTRIFTKNKDGKKGQTWRVSEVSVVDLLDA
jgi:Holliday junction resolvase YEN1